MRTTSSLAKYILRSWQVFRLKIIVLAPSQFPSGILPWLPITAAGPLRICTWFQFKICMYRLPWNYAFVFLFFVFLLCNICYLVVKIFECFYRISPFVLMIFWYFTISSVSLLDQYGSCSDKSIWKPTRIHILLLWYFLWSVLMLALCILFQYALR